MEQKGVFPTEEYIKACNQLKDQGKLPEEPIAIAEESEGDSINLLDEKISTAVIQAPSADAMVATFQCEAESLLKYAEVRIIETKDDMDDATNDLSIISRAKKRLEERRKEYIQPLNDQVKLINDTFKLVSEPLGQADKVTREKILECREAQEKLRQEQEEINRLRTEAAKKEMGLKGELTESLDLVEVAPEPPTHIYTDLGTTSAAKIRKWEIENFAELSNEYKMPDASKIGRVVRAGIPSIPGIRIWQEESLRVSTRRGE